MNYEEAVRAVKDALAENTSDLEEVLSDMGSLVDYAGAPRILSALHQAMRSMSEDIMPWKCGSGDGITIEFKDGVISNISASPASDSALLVSPDLRPIHDPLREETIVMLLILSGYPCDLLAMYLIQFGKHGQDPDILGMNHILEHGAVTTHAVGAARSLWVAGKLQIDVLDELEAAYVEGSPQVDTQNPEETLDGGSL